MWFKHVELYSALCSWVVFLHAIPLLETQSLPQQTINYQTPNLLDAAGIHASIPKWAFTNIEDTTTPYTGAKVIPGSSRPVGYPTMAPAPAPSMTAAALAAAGKR